MRPLLILVMLLGFACATDAARSAAPRRTPPVAVIIKGERRSPELRAAIVQTIRRTNELRLAEGRAPLVISRELTAAAESFAAFMADTELYGHDADGSEPAARAAKAGYESCIVAENLAYHYLSTGFTTEELVQALLEGWMDSPGHRANLLDPDITELGVAIARSQKSGKYYGIQLFGRPRSLQLEFTVKNETGNDMSYDFTGESLPLPAGTTVRHQLCRPTKLVFHWPGRQPETTLDAENAHHYVAVRAQGGKFRVDQSAAR